MTTDEHFDGEVHGLLAGAFDDGLPAVNLVPGAVDGFRRHRRRARVLGGAGGALAVAGVVAAGAAVPSWGGGTSGARSAAAGGPAGLSVTTAATHPASKPAPVTPACHSTAYYKFGDSAGIDWYLGGLGALQAVCDRDVAALKDLIPGAVVTPQTLTEKSAKQWHDTTAGMPLPQVSEDTPIVNTGSYTVVVDGHAVLAELDFSTKEISWGGDCVSGKCPLNLRLADGTPARSFTDAQDAFVVVFSDGSHVANVRFANDDKSARPLSFDAGALFRSGRFAELISADTAQLDQLTHT